MAEETTGNDMEQVEESEVQVDPQFMGMGTGVVQMLRIEDINVDDKTYRFRSNLRTKELKDSLKSQGQQMPLIVLARKGNKGTFQLISGFRRLSAAIELGWTQIAALERVLTDEEAFRASVLENTARETYSDLDRAYVVHEYRKRGYSNQDIGKVMSLSSKQVRNIGSLLELPECAQAAIDDPDQYFSTTHALRLKQLAQKYPDIEWESCIESVNEKKSSVAQLIRDVNKDYRSDTPAELESLFQAKGTRIADGIFRFAPVKIDVSKLTSDEKKRIRGELQKLLKKLG